MHTRMKAFETLQIFQSLRTLLYETALMIVIGSSDNTLMRSRYNKSKTSIPNHKENSGNKGDQDSISQILFLFKKFNFLAGFFA